MASNQATVTQDLLARAHSPDSANRIYADKIQHRPLFVKPNSPPPPDARDLRREARLDKQARARRAPKPRPLSSRQRRALGLHDVPKEGGGQQKQKYAVFEPLHALWLGYAREILGAELYTGGGGQGAAARLCSADFHGAVVEVTRQTRVPFKQAFWGLIFPNVSPSPSPFPTYRIPRTPHTPSFLSLLPSSVRGHVVVGPSGIPHLTPDTIPHDRACTQT